MTCPEFLGGISVHKSAVYLSEAEGPSPWSRALSRNLEYLEGLKMYVQAWSKIEVTLL